MQENQVVIAIINVQNWYEKCYDKVFAWYSVFSPKMWNFVAEFARNQIKIKSSVDKAFWDETK